MEEYNDQLKDLKDIRNMMERSSRFISLSGLSGVVAGCFALAGAITAWWLITSYKAEQAYEYFTYKVDYIVREKIFYLLLADAAIVFILAVAAGIYFTTRNAKKKGQSMWDSTTRRLLINLSIPLATGGYFCVVLLYYGLIGLIAPATLIFYGLALINASKYTLNDVRYLGTIQIVLGMIACFMLGHGILFWAMGFGVAHIMYGIIMYNKYEK